MLPEGAAADPELRRRFEQEALAVAALSHPNIVALHDVGTHDGAPFLVSEQLAGTTLAEALQGTVKDIVHPNLGWFDRFLGPVR